MRTIRRIEWAAVLLLSLVCHQAIFGLGDSPILWLKRAWKNRDLSGMQRSALFLLGGTGSKFMEFIATNVPQEQAVVVPERSAAFSAQNTLSYYLAPRKAIACGCDSYGNRCFSCLSKADHAVPVTRNFPPEDWDPGNKQYISFDTAESDYYLGLYVSPGWETNQVSTARSLPLALAAWLDGLVWTGWLLLGVFALRWNNPSQAWPETLALAILIGMGLHTWVIFVFSWVGVPITVGSTFISFLLLLAAVQLGARKQTGGQRLLADIERHGESFLRRLKQASILKKALACTAVGLLTVVTAIAVTRSYSTYDDIAIWSLKGHIIAREGTIFAARETSGHGLAYPLNLSLMITVFRLVDGDALPGSKLLFPLTLAVIAFGFYRFWRQRGVPTYTALAAVLLLFSIPVVFLHATLGFANLTFTAYLLSGVLWGLRGLESGARCDIFLSGLLFALAGWTRPEGILFAGVSMLALGSVQQLTERRKPLVVYAIWAIPMLLPLAWLIFAANDIRQDQAGSALQASATQLLSNRFSLDAVKTTLSFAWQQGTDIRTWGNAVIFAVLAVLLFTFRLWKNLANRSSLVKLIAVAGSSVLVPLALFAVESANESDFHTFLTVSFDRAFFPAAFLLILWAVWAMGSRSPKAPETQEAV
ncbi:MAG: hypothetical protein ACOYYS_25345 [Chloroflexota bacterium]